MAVEKHVAGGQRCSDWAACNERQGIAPPPAAAQPEAQRAFDRQPDAHAAFAAEGDGELTACSVVEAVRWREATDTEWWLDNDDAIARVERYAQQQLERFHATFGEPKALRAEIAARDADLAKLATAIRQANAADTAGHLIADMDPLAYVVSVLDGEHGPAAPSRDESKLRRVARDLLKAAQTDRAGETYSVDEIPYALFDELRALLAAEPDSGAGMAEGNTEHARRYGTALDHLRSFAEAREPSHFLIRDGLTYADVRETLEGIAVIEKERDAARAELARANEAVAALKAQPRTFAERTVLRSTIHKAREIIADAEALLEPPPTALGAGPREGED